MQTLLCTSTMLDVCASHIKIEVNFNVRYRYLENGSTFPDGKLPTAMKGSATSFPATPYQRDRGTNCRL